jgi:hypothetical protein
MNHVTAVQVAQEFCMPAYDENGKTVVAFFRRHEGNRQKLEFCIPVDNESECTQLAIRFQELFLLAMQRYEEMVTGRLQIPCTHPDETVARVTMRLPEKESSK